MTQHQVLEYDVVVIGAGGAGLRTAIEAATKGASVGLICKSLLGKAHTVMAEGALLRPLPMLMTETVGKSILPTR